MNKPATQWLSLSIFPLLHALVLSGLFWITESFITRDAGKIISWSAAGFALGLASGYVIQRSILRRIDASKKIPLLLTGSFLLIEAALGLLVIGPFIWVLLRFVPISNIHSICCETPADYGASHYETMQLKTEDGAVISGWYIAPGTQQGKAIILIHGYGYDRRGTDFQTRALIAAGYGVLLYDLRDHGESTGAINAFNRMDVYQADLSKVVAYLKQKPEINPQQIGVVGISLGAFATLNSTPTVLNEFAALWLDGLRFENFGAQQPVHNMSDIFKRIFDYQTRVIAQYYYHEKISPPPLLFTQIIPTITHPKLMLVASGLDESERQTNEKLIPLIGNKKQLWIIDNAWHIGGRFEVPDEYTHKLLDFFALAFSEATPN